MKIISSLLNWITRIFVKKIRDNNFTVSEGINSKLLSENCRKVIQQKLNDGQRVEIKKFINVKGEAKAYGEYRDEDGNLNIITVNGVFVGFLKP